VPDFPTLADLIADHTRVDEWGGPEWDCGANEHCDGGGTSYEDYAAHIQAEWLKSRIIETVDQLDALPDGAVVLADNKAVWQKTSGWSPDEPWWVAGSSVESPSNDIALPARLLHHPGDSQ
jgi:hypothetical protein